MPRVILPANLTHTELYRMIAASCADRPSDDDRDWEFDWRDVVWVNLPQAVQVLLWSSQLAGADHRVLWVLTDPRTPTDAIDDLRFNAKLELGEQYDKTRQRLSGIVRKMLSKELGAGACRTALRSIGESLGVGSLHRVSPVRRWWEQESTPLLNACVMSYLELYGFFDMAQLCGVHILPDPSDIAMPVMERRPDTACLELTPIGSRSDLDGLVARLDSETELSRVLSVYSKLGVARSGALSHVIVNELGKNVVEHAAASAAWVCTRLLPGAERIAAAARTDPVLRNLRHSDLPGMLEIIVADNGRGIAATLGETLKADARDVIKQKYGLEEGRTAPEPCILDYSFDRLSSSQRDTAVLLHASDAPDSSGSVASGLYWVWNLARAHRGILCVISGRTYGWYDFTSDGHLGPSWRDMPMQVDARPAKLGVPGSDCTFFPGTMLRVLLPLPDEEQITARRRQFRLSERPAATRPWATSVSGPHVQVEWLGDILQRRRSDGPSNGASHSWSERGFLENLGEKHQQLKEGDVLVLDVSGTRHQWEIRKVELVCRFFIEMNFVATGGRSTVLLWDVPASDRGLFDACIKAILEDHPHLLPLRKLAMMVLDDGTLVSYPPQALPQDAVDFLASEGDGDLDDLGITALSEADAETAMTVLQDNAHLFDIGDDGRVHFRAWPEEIRRAVFETRSLEIGMLADRLVSEGGALRSAPDGAMFRLPSTKQLAPVFYQCTGLLANVNTRARVSWCLAQVIRALNQQSGNQISLLVSVTRSTMSLVTELGELYFSDMSVATAPTLGELKEAFGDASDHAIMVTDVVSSGTLCEAVRTALPNIRWHGTVAIIDTRGHGETTSIAGYSLFTTPHQTAISPVYALTVKNVPKSDRSSVDPAQVIAIDPIHNSPLRPGVWSDLQSHSLFDVWSLVEASPSSLKIGHLHTAQYHHYVYYVDVADLLAARVGKRTAAELLADEVAERLARLGSTEGHSVIMHIAPGVGSRGHTIAPYLQDATGISSTHELWRDAGVERFRFNPFVEHGAELQEMDVVLVDDGINSCDTAIALLDTAVQASPSNILGVFALARTDKDNLYKLDLLSRIEGVRGVTGSVGMLIMSVMHIPVYSRHNCPICHLMGGLEVLRSASEHFDGEVADLIAALGPEDAHEHRSGAGFPFMASHTLLVARFREALELADYEQASASSPAEGGGPATTQRSRKVILDTIADAVERHRVDRLLDVGFVIACEPRLAEALASQIEIGRLLDETVAAISVCEPDSIDESMLTLFSLAHAASRVGMDSDQVEETAARFWSACLARRDISARSIRRAVSLLLARFLADKRAGLSADLSVAEAWIAALEHLCGEPNSRKESPPSTGSSEAFEWMLYMGLSASRHARMILSSTGQTQRVESGTAYDPLEFRTLAADASGDFWTHRQKNFEKDLRALRSVLDEPDQRNQVLRQLWQSLDRLDRLCIAVHTVERELRPNPVGPSTVSDAWSDPVFLSGLTALSHALIQISDALTNPVVDPEIIDRTFSSMERTWVDLRPALDAAFGGIFVDVSKVRYNQWDARFFDLSHLPIEVAQRGKRAEPTLTRRGRPWNEGDYAFIPRNLVETFFEVAMENLSVWAFEVADGAAVDELQPGATAHCMLEVVETTPGTDQRAISIRIVNNGRDPDGANHAPQDETEPKRSHTGLKGVQKVAEWFGGKVLRPRKMDEWVEVELQLHHIDG